MPEPAPLYPVNRDHLDVLTDQVGIMQHAIGSRPDPAHGYCVDDVARALQVDLLHARQLGWAAVAERAWNNIRFLSEAFDDMTGRFRNFRRVDGSWVEGRASDDSQGRAMLALGETIAGAPDRRMVTAATALFADALPQAQRVTAMRAQASVLLGCDAAVRVSPTRETVQAYRLLASQLRTTFRGGVGSDWPWPEDRLTYENALPVRAMIVAGQYFGSRQMVEDGLALLDWLIVTQTADDGHFSPVGNGWWPRDGEKAPFDQQPIEATALLLAAETAYSLTSDERYLAAMERAYAWFLGANDLGVEIADPERGAGRDGLTPRGANTNEGAESTLMWLMALEHIRAIRSGAGVVAAAARAAEAPTDGLLAAATR